MQHIDPAKDVFAQFHRDDRPGAAVEDSRLTRTGVLGLGRHFGEVP